MNGTTTQLPSLKDKLDQSKTNSKKEKLVFIFSVLISNAFVFLLTSNDNVNNEANGKFYTNHEGFQTILITAENLTAPDVKGFTNYISVINEKNEIVIKDAYFIQKDNSKFKIEISNLELKKAPSLSSDKLIIVPHIDMETKVTKVLKENLYEVEI